MLSKEEIENGKAHLRWMFDNGILTSEDDSHVEAVLEYIEQLETDKQKLIEKLEERIRSVEKCYQDLIKSYYDETINMINTSLMTKKEKEEFINTRNCLLVQKHCYKEILKILKGEKK